MKLFKYFFPLLILFSASNLQVMPGQDNQPSCDCHPEVAVACAGYCFLTIVCCCTEAPKELWKSASGEFNRPSYVSKPEIKRDFYDKNKCFTEKRSCRGFGLARRCNPKKTYVQCPDNQKMR